MGLKFFVEYGLEIVCFALLFLPERVLVAAIAFNL
jgi:hypothetical protein